MGQGKDSAGAGRTIGQQLELAGVSRRDFLKFCAELMVVAPVGLGITSKVRAAEVAREILKARRPSVIWLHMQDCTGCSETLLRTTAPGLAELILQLISLDYHETLMAASGKQAEEALATSMKENAGKYVLVVEGAIPEKANGTFLLLGGKPGIEVLRDVAAKAAAVISIGSCASWGGIPSADPNPTGATGVDSIIKDKPVINLPGCPPNPYNLLATVLQYATFGTLPELDDLHRPKFAYDRVIHDHCPRRAHFDNGRFARTFGDEGHRHGWCLYHLGCKGPETHAVCSTRHFNEVVDAWPIGIGAPCFGCTEKSLAFRVPMSQTAKIRTATPPDTYAPVATPQGNVSAAAVGLAGLIGGALLGGGMVASRKLGKVEEGGEKAKAGKE